MDCYYHSKDLGKFGEMGKGNPALWEKFMNYYSAVFAEGALTEREKALIALGVAQAVQCPYCIDAYTQACLEKGSNMEEMTEAVHVACAIRGGASLVYGPQPAGALNYVTLMPRTDRALGVRQQFIMGTDDLISSYTAVDGTIGKLGYHGYFAHRSADGFRQANSDYETNGGRVKPLIRRSASREFRRSLVWP